MKKYFLLTTLLLIAFGVQPAKAYNPPPAMNLMALMTPRIQIKLPPILVAVPYKLIFPDGQSEYTFNDITKQFDGGPYFGHKISTRIVNPGPGTEGQYYVISITGWKVSRQPPVKDFRIRFKTPITKANIVRLEGFLKINSADTASLSGPSCSGGTSHICLKTITSVRAFGLSLTDTYLFQALPVTGVFVEGNTAASGTLANFILSPKALAVGGTISIQGGSKQLSQYTMTGTPISWNIAEPIIRKQFAKRIAGTTINGGSAPPNWNLNAPNSDPSSGLSDSFSTPPEGKLWRIKGNNNDLMITGGGTTFKGSGTIAIDGNLVINGDITCESNTTRLGFLVGGNITVNPGNKAINCGAFVALGVALGNTGITLSVPQPSKQGTYKVIYISAKDINLPDPSNLTGPYTINYDSYFAKNPTALFSEILSIVFGS